MVKFHVNAPKCLERQDYSVPRNILLDRILHILADPYHCDMDQLFEDEGAEKRCLGVLENQRLYKYLQLETGNFGEG